MNHVGVLQTVAQEDWRAGLADVVRVNRRVATQPIYARHFYDGLRIVELLQTRFRFRSDPHCEHLDG